MLHHNGMVWPNLADLEILFKNVMSDANHRCDFCRLIPFNVVIVHRYHKIYLD